MAIHSAHKQLGFRQHDLDSPCPAYQPPALASFDATTGWALARVDEQTPLSQLQHLLSFNHFSIICFQSGILFLFLLDSHVERLATQNTPI